MGIRLAPGTHIGLDGTDTILLENNFNITCKKCGSDDMELICEPMGQDASDGFQNFMSSAHLRCRNCSNTALISIIESVLFDEP